MNLQSPTSLLSSIQSMKNKLRNDKQTLLDLKNDFTNFNRKKGYQQNSQETFVLADITNNQINKSQREPYAVDAVPKKAIFQLKKEYQREMVRLQQKHQKEISQILRIKNLEIEDLEGKWKIKLEEQADYILILEEQASPIQSERQKVPHQQYDIVINKLLQDNTRLHEEVIALREQNQKWRNLTNQLERQNKNKNRFKFTKVKKEEVINGSQYEKSKISHKRVNSVYVYNNQNVDSFNISQDNEWEDDAILADEGGLKTIRQFQRSTHEDNKKNNMAYLSLKI